MKVTLGLISVVFIILLIYIISKPRSDWKNEFFNYFYEFGFYKEYSTVLEAKKEIINNYKNEWGKDDLIKQDRFIELLLLTYDKKAIYMDTECDVCKGNNSYVYLMEELKKLTDSKFQPTNIHEKWESEEGPIQVQYYLDDLKHIINPAYNDDYIDLNFVHELNNGLDEYGFEIYEIQDQSVFIFFLSSKEKERLIMEKQFRFMW